MSRTACDANSLGHLALVACHPSRTGGMETFCRFLTETALSAGWRVTVGLSCENIYESLQARHPHALSIQHVGWLDATCAGDREYCFSRILERRRWFRAVRPDVALFVQSSNTPFRSAIAGARLAGVPVVSTHRTMAWPIETVPSRRHCLGLIPGIGLHGRALVFKTWLTAALADKVVYNSAAVRTGYESIYRYPCSRGQVISNAVRPPQSTATETRTDRPVTIGFAGRLGNDKRLDILLRAVAALQPDLNGCVRPRLVIYGEGADRPRLEKLAFELGIDHRVEWRGVTRDPYAAYADMDIVALCSPRESSSNMVLEAMAAGKAVVTTDAGGMPELLDQGQCGLCVPALDVTALAEALRQLVNDPGLRQSLGEQARRKALLRHDPNVISGQWMALLSEVVHRRVTHHGDTEITEKSRLPRFSSVSSVSPW